MFIFSFLLIFFKTSYSESHKLERLSAVEITQKLEQSPKSIVFVTDDEELISFAYPAIEKYKDRIDFHLTSPGEVPSSFYTGNPSIIVFNYLKPLKIDSAPREPSSFIRWVERIIDPSHYDIVTSDQLEIILKGSIPALFDIDDAKSEIKAEDTVTVFKASSSLFRKFSIEISAGFYVFRPQDRQFLKYNGTFSKQAFSRLTHFSEIGEKSSKTVISFIVDEWGTVATRQYELLESLSYEFGCENFYYTLIHSSDARIIFKGISIHSIKRPAFIVANISSYPFHKWIFNQTEGEVTFESIKEFVIGVISHQLAPTVISEPVPNYSDEKGQSVTPIVNSNFADFVYDDTCETVVLFSEENNLKSKVVDTIFRAISKILDNKYTKFYSFDVAKNDIPPEIPKISKYPTIMMFPAGIKDQPKVLNEEMTFQRILDFVQDFASHKFAVPKFDIKKVKNSINEKISKLFNIDKNDPGDEL